MQTKIIFAFILANLYLVYASPVLELPINTTVRATNVDKRDLVNALNFARYGGSISYPAMVNDFAFGATALITRNSYDAHFGSSADSSILPTGWDEIGVTGNHRHRCHIVANQLGGSGKDGRNLFTCHAFFNSVVMLYYENQIAAHVKDMPSSTLIGLVPGVRYTVSLNYLHTGATSYPFSADLLAETTLGTLTTTTLLNVRIYNMPSNSQLYASQIVFLCEGTLGMSWPSSVPNDRVSTSSTPC